MYHTLVRRKLERIFSELSRGNYDFALAGVASRLEHSFAGNHPPWRCASHACCPAPLV